MKKIWEFYDDEGNFNEDAYNDYVLQKEDELIERRHEEC